MKRIAAVVVGWLVLTFHAMAADQNATFGQHGMALFGGKDALYASHLPMYHAPHDYQVVMRVHLADAAQDAALRKRLDGKSALWTIAPDKFELDRLAPGAANPLRQFKADIVLGHFEQGGKTQYAGAEVVVDQVLVYRKLMPQPIIRESARYLQVGSGARRFLVKEIDSRPDFDHIVAISAKADTPAAPFSVRKQALSEPKAATLAEALPGARVLGTVYFYTDDLK
jgi:hypothetical protein